MVKILIGCTGSVATIKLPLLVKQLLNENIAIDKDIKICLTTPAKHFLNYEELNKTIVYTDTDEWEAWSTRGDPVLHIELAKWADILLIAPLDANTLAKVSNGICDNLLTCVVRAWDLSKPLIFCPAMNTKMYQHPLTSQQILTLKAFGYHEIPVITKELICGDTGPGAMAEVATIVEFVKNVSNHSNIVE